MEQAKRLLDDDSEEEKKEPSLTIPVIDLSTSTSEDLLAALESTGFFYLK